MTQPIDPTRDLTFERVVNLKPELIWSAWTTPKHILHWFTPAPWRTIECEIDLMPGGKFNTVMLSPEGEKFPNSGCILEVVPGKKLVWTNAFEPGFRPVTQAGSSDSFPFTAIIALEPAGESTRYTATVIHRDEEGKNTHASMGFHEGWGKALDQLIEYMGGF